jgi:hypothetical protein
VNEEIEDMISENVKSVQGVIQSEGIQHDQAGFRKSFRPEAPDGFKTFNIIIILDEFEIIKDELVIECMAVDQNAYKKDKHNVHERLKC